MKDLFPIRNHPSIRVVGMLFFSLSLVAGCCGPYDPVVRTGSVDPGSYSMILASTSLGNKEFGGVQDLVVEVQQGGDEVELRYTDADGQSVVARYSMGGLVRDGTFCFGDEEICTEACPNFPNIYCSECGPDSQCYLDGASSDALVESPSDSESGEGDEANDGNSGAQP